MRRWILALALLAGCGPNQLALGDLQLQGVTSDGFAIVSDKSGKLIALSLADQSAEVIGTDRDAIVEIDGAMVVAFGSEALNPVAAIWTHATGIIPSPPGIAHDDFRAAPDGSAFAYLAPHLLVQPTGGMPRATTDDLVVGQWQFVGHKLVAVIDDGLTLAAFDPESGAATTLVTGHDYNCPFVADRTGTHILTCNNGDGLLVPLDGSSPRDLGSDYAGGWIGANGSSVFYRTKRSALVRDDGPIAGKTTLVDDGTVCELTDHAPDDGALLFSACSGEELIRTVRGAMPMLVSPDRAPAGPSFTVDSSFALDDGKIDAFSGKRELDAFAVATGDKVVVPGDIKKYLTPDGARLLAVTPSASGDMTFDLQLFDLAQSDLAPKTLATGVDSGIFLAPDGKSVLFTIPAQGLFQQPL